MKQRFSMWWVMLVLVLAIGPAYGSPFLKAFDGTLHSLDEYTGKGKWTVVMIWAYDCSVCNAEAENYVKFHNAHKDKDAFILGISMDGKEHKSDAVKFIQRHKVDFQNLIDEPENVADLYSSLTGKPWVGTPTFLIFSPSGELRAAQVGAVPTNLIASYIAKHSEPARKSATP